MEKTRVDYGFVANMVQNLIGDVPTAVETESLDEWAEAVGSLANYMRARHKRVYSE